MLDVDVRAAYRAVFNFHDKWQHLPTAPIEEWCKAAAEMPALCIDKPAKPLTEALMLAVWEELSRQRKEVLKDEQQAQRISGRA